MVTYIAVALLVSLGSFATPAWAVKSYSVGNGPYWATNPPTVTCLETCALLFGGTTSDWSCSTNGSSVDHAAFVSAWGVSGCPVVSESYKLNSAYNCGSYGCSYSAYVQDNCYGTNYCFPTHCGDGHLDPGEDCDDGNLVDGDCCSAACTFEAA